MKMMKKAKIKRKDPLDQLIQNASHEILGRLIKELSVGRPEIRRDCFEFLKEHVRLSSDDMSVSSGEMIFAIPGWKSL